jgi:hypothetical protein
MDIPGCVMQPAHREPIARYGIDAKSFNDAQIPEEIQDRIYKSLFVYSVGFYELIKSLLKHNLKRSGVITNIWKVFNILLEYCCRTDYKMLIAEQDKKYQEIIDTKEKEFAERM